MTSLLLTVRVKEVVQGSTSCLTTKEPSNFCKFNHSEECGLPSGLITTSSSDGNLQQASKSSTYKAAAW